MPPCAPAEVHYTTEISCINTLTGKKDKYKYWILVFSLEVVRHCEAHEDAKKKKNWKELWKCNNGNSRKGQLCLIMKTCEQRHPTLRHSGLESYCSSVSGLYEVWPEPWTSQEWYVLDPSVELFPAKMIEPFSSLTPQPFLWPVYCQRIPKRPETLVEGSQPVKWRILFESRITDHIKSHTWFCLSLCELIYLLV